MSNTRELKLQYIIPPYVRGLTFDGVKGLFAVKTESDKSDNILGFTAEKNESLPSVLSSVTKQFKEYIAEEGKYPAAFRVPGGELYGLGSTYDEALRAGGCSADPQQPGSKARGDVVKNKIALVTGGAQGFGEGMVCELVEAGAFTFIADMNFDGAQRLAERLNKKAGRTAAMALEVNVTSEESVEAMLEQVTQVTGGLDIFISNAGVLKAGSVKEMSLSDFSFVTSVDYTGFFICTKYAARLLSIQNRAAHDYMSDIIVISSKSGLEGSNKNGAYAGAKFGVIGLTQSFALELVSDRIKVNALCPGNFLDGPLWSDPDRGLFVQYLRAGKVPGAETVADVRSFYEAKVPLGRGCTTEDVMKAVYYCVEQLYETGQAVPVTGGQVMMN
ncbi:MAG: SDR family NAD(P)-dependent oxidoreductase [Spirochaetales bacterium]|jgi:sorbitol-6-phosphate 2-dehydrogenase|nr:SDR family NAD(P)-dependent oxidoreductase [Spirochaetales bacterium]